MAAVQAAADAAAQRLKHEQKQEFTSALTVLGETLQNKGWQEYKRIFERLAFTNDWDPGLFDLDIANAWDEAAEDDEMEQDRKNIVKFSCFCAPLLVSIRTCLTHAPWATLK